MLREIACGHRPGLTVNQVAVNSRPEVHRLLIARTVVLSGDRVRLDREAVSWVLPLGLMATAHSSQAHDVATQEATTDSNHDTSIPIACHQGDFTAYYVLLLFLLRST